MEWKFYTVLLKKKIKNLFQVNYNKSAFPCNPCLDACKKVNKKINGRELSKVSNKEMKKLINFFSSWSTDSFYI